MTKNINNKSKDPSREQWEKLYSLADNIKTLEPWKHFWDTDIIEVDASEHESCFCSIMGGINECFGVAIYIGTQGLAKLCKILTNNELPGYVCMTSQEALILYWGDRNELTPVDRNTIKSIGRSYRGRGEWPYYRNFTQGLYPWYLTAYDADCAGVALEQLFIGITDLLQSSEEFVLPEGKRLCRRQDPTTKEWRSVIEPVVTEVVAEIEACKITDELLIRRLLKKKKSNSELEFDMPSIPIPIKSEKGRRPFYPRLALLADRMRGVIELQYPVDVVEDAPGIALGVLTEYIEKSGSPSIIYVRDEDAFALISDFCTKLNISLHLADTLLVVDEYMESLLEDFSIGENNGY